MQETFYTVQTPTTIAVVADLHNRPYFSVLASLRSRRPGIICITGDLFHAFRPHPGKPYVLQVDPLLPFLRDCCSIAPCFYSYGNHEWMLTEADLALIRATGTVILDNSWVRLGNLCIGGLSSAYVREYRRINGEHSGSVPKRDFFGHGGPVPDLNWLSEFEAQPGYRLLLSHHPEYWFLYLSRRKIDLIVSGHAHGGQIRIHGQGLFAPGQGLFPTYTAGVHGNMVVSRGLSNTAGIVPRLGNPTELVYIR